MAILVQMQLLAPIMRTQVLPAGQVHKETDNMEGVSTFSPVSHFYFLQVVHTVDA